MDEKNGWSSRDWLQRYGSSQHFVGLLWGTLFLLSGKQDNLRLSSKCFLQPNLELDNWIGLKALGAGVTRVFDGKNTAVSIFHSSKIVQMIQGNQAREESDEILWTSLGTTHVWRYSKIFSSKVWEDLLWEMVKDTPRPHNDKTW